MKMLSNDTESKLKVSSIPFNMHKRQLISVLHTYICSNSLIFAVSCDAIIAIIITIYVWRKDNGTYFYKVSPCRHPYLSQFVTGSTVKFPPMR